MRSLGFNLVRTRNAGLRYDMLRDRNVLEICVPRTGRQIEERRVPKLNVTTVLWSRR